MRKTVKVDATFESVDRAVCFPGVCAALILVMTIDVSLMRVSALIRSGDEFDRAHRYLVHA